MSDHCADIVVLRVLNEIKCVISNEYISCFYLQKILILVHRGSENDT